MSTQLNSGDSASGDLASEDLGSGDLAADRRFLWAKACADVGDHAGAADLFRQALELAPGWASAWFALGEALAALGDVHGASAAFQACLMRAPDDLFGASLRLARLGNTAGPGHMPQRYVARLFDDYAARFDSHLTQTLNYRGPQVLMTALATASRILGRPDVHARVMDLGCGTGLMAKALGDHAGSIDGIDLSRAMLARAEATGRYNTLEAGDLTDCLNARALPVYNLIIAADVFVYLGDLASVLAAAVARLAPSGLLAFTVQHMDGEGFALGSDMRFAHAPAYLRAAAEAAGLKMIVDAPAVTRQDAGADVPGRVCVLARHGA